MTDGNPSGYEQIYNFDNGIIVIDWQYWPRISTSTAKHEFEKYGTAFYYMAQRILQSINLAPWMEELNTASSSKIYVSSNFRASNKSLLQRQPA